MNDEKARILTLVETGKVTAAEGLELIKAFEAETTNNDENSQVLMSRNVAKTLHVRVEGDKVKKANISFPLNLIKAASKFMGIGMNFIPKEIRMELESKGIDLSQLDFEELIKLIDQGLIVDKLVDIDVNDPEKGLIKIKVYVE
ncbi:hypothetical protein V6C27_08065 [Peptococcaceae bacterium 1198_IL3148]